MTIHANGRGGCRPCLHWLESKPFGPSAAEIARRMRTCCEIHLPFGTCVTERGFTRLLKCWATQRPRPPKKLTFRGSRNWRKRTYKTRAGRCSTQRGSPIEAKKRRKANKPVETAIQSCYIDSSEILAGRGSRAWLRIGNRQGCNFKAYSSRQPRSTPAHGKCGNYHTVGKGTRPS